MKELYLPSPSFLPNFNASAHWWGMCDDKDYPQGNQTLPRLRLFADGTRTRPPRAALGFDWVPQGDGCDQLRHGLPDSLPPVDQLVSLFCSRFAGQHILFVGEPCFVDASRCALFLFLSALAE